VSDDWKVWAGVGLIEYAPLSDERRAVIAREAERERLQAERDAELRRELAAERRAELQFQGRQPRTQQELLAQASQAQDRQDRRDEKADEAYLERFGHGRPSRWVGQLAAVKAERKQREADAEATPASKAELGRVAKKLANAIHNITGQKPVL
jgi:hypothetical protein